MGFDKTLTPVGGAPMIWHSVNAFECAESIREIIVVTAAEREHSIREVLTAVAKPLQIVHGGATRQESVLAGLKAVSEASAFVAVHDAARPLITPDLVETCVDAARRFGGSAAAERVTDTLQRGREEQFCAEPLDRAGLWRMQTPQTFPLGLLLAACEDVTRSNWSATDETSVMRRAGHPVYLIENFDWNFKVTLPRDVPIADFLLRARSAEFPI